MASAKETMSVIDVADLLVGSLEVEQRGSLPHACRSISKGTSRQTPRNGLFRVLNSLSQESNSIENRREKGERYFRVSTRKRSGDLAGLVDQNLNATQIRIAARCSMAWGKAASREWEKGR